MSHAVFSIVTEVLRGHEDALDRLLRGVEADHARNGIIDFTQLTKLHFASFTLFRTEVEQIPLPENAPQPALLVFEHNVDGRWDEHLDALIAAGPGLWKVYRHCKGAPGEADDRALSAYLRGHVQTPNLHHVGTPYRRVDTVRADLDLRMFLERQADRLAQNGGGQPPGTAWNRLRAAANPPAAGGDLSPNVNAQTGEVTWESRHEPRWRARLRHWGTFIGLFLMAVAAVAWAIARLWPHPARLSAAFVILFAALGIFTSVVIGWPVFPRDRTRPPGETPGRTLRALLLSWRNTVNIWLWFALIGWLVSLVPAGFRLLGIQLSSWPVWIAAVPFALGTVVILVFLVGQWSLPTPQLDRRKPERERLRRVTDQEDIRVINHMSAMVELRPGLFRSLSLRALLWSLEKTWFHTVLPDLSKGRLFTFSTVHFAQWVMLGKGRYMFLSNYDHSFSRYLDDFGGISFGLARLWGMGAHSPGLANLERFKDFARTWMTPHLVWYSAYPDAAVTQVWNNEALRRGLLADPATVDHEELLQRLVNAKDR